MSLGALLLVLGAAVLHAGWNALAKRGRDPVAFLWWASVLASGFFLPPSAWLLWRDGLPAAALPFVAATIGLHAAYFFLLGRSYGAADYSLVYPVARGLGVALVAVAALPVLGERPSALGAAGVVLVVAGIFALNWRPGTWRGAAWGPGLGWAAATGVSIAAYSLVDKAGVARLHPVPYLWLMELGSWLVLLPVVLRRPAALGREWRSSPATIAAAAVMSPGAYCLVLFAFQLSKAGYVVAAREISIVLSTLIGSLWLKEGHLPRRLAGAAVVAAGVACVALAR